MNDLMQDPMFFYSIAFVIFLGLAWHYGRKPALAWIDTEILKIRDELDRARNLRKDAEAMLADYKMKQTAAMAEAEAIVRHAKDEAARLKTQFEANLKNILLKHEQHGAERIRLAELEAVTAIRMATIDLAMKLARTAVSSRLDDAAATRLTDQAIGDLAKLAGDRAKAA